MTTPELGQRLQAAMQEAEMSPTDLIELLLSFRGEDPNDRRAWERAKRAVARWRNGPSQSIQNDGERAFIERHLDLAEAASRRSGRSPSSGGESTRSRTSPRGPGRPISRC